MPEQLENILAYLKNGSESITEQRIKKIAANMAEKKTESQLIDYKKKQIFLEDEVARLQREIGKKWWDRFLKR